MDIVGVGVAVKTPNEINQNPSVSVCCVDLNQKENTSTLSHPLRNILVSCDTFFYRLIYIRYLCTSLVFLLVFLVFIIVVVVILVIIIIVVVVVIIFVIFLFFNGCKIFLFDPFGFFIKCTNQFDEINNI